MEWLQQIVDSAWFLVDFILHVDMHLNDLIIHFGMWTYVILFLIIFCETGLVVMPLLPGDSLLFAAGALTAIDGSPLNIHILALLLMVAAIIGDAVNYSAGKYFGPRVFRFEDSLFFNKKHLLHTQSFYHRHGGKTIIMARFIPIIRTFAPFVAGIGNMRYLSFAAYNVSGALIWVGLFLYTGYWMGNLPAVKSNFHVIIFAIILLSITPPIVEFFRVKLKKRGLHPTST